MFASIAARMLADGEAECYLCSDNPIVTIFATILWLALLGWVFCALAIVADDYLCVALDKITKYTQVPQNVGSAVFLAFGSAVPEIMTSIMSVINGKVDASLPAILGSGCIAYAVIPPVCVLAIQPFMMKNADRLHAPEGSDIARFYRKKQIASNDLRRGSVVARERRDSLALKLTRSLSGESTDADGGLVRTKSAHTVPYTNTVLADVSGKMLPMRLAQMPLIRDVGTYLLSLGLTVWFINDSQMTTVESSILFGLYLFYLVVLVAGKEYWGEDEGEGEESQPLMSEAASSGEESPSKKTETESFAVGTPRTETAKTDPEVVVVKNEDEEEATTEEEAATEEATAVVASEEAGHGHGHGHATDRAGEVGGDNGSQGGSGSGCGSGAVAVPSSPGGEDEEEDDDESLFLLAVNYPFYTLFSWTIPDCEDEDWEDWFAVSFIISLIYISILASITLTIVTQLSLSLGLPQSLSGMTLIAMGAEVPDCVASMALAKKGEGPAAVSNCLNSQIINLLVGLGLPYLIHDISTGLALQLGSAGNTQVFIGMLLAVLVVAFVWFTLGLQGCYGLKHTQLDVSGSVVLLTLYAGVVVSVIVYSYSNE